jgi:hypothetical protein
MSDPNGPTGPGWRKRSTGDFLTFEVGQVFEGYFVGTTTVNDRVRYIVRERATGDVKVVPEHVQLSRALKDGVAESAEVYIHCKGKIPVKNRGTEMFTYNVYIRNPDDPGYQPDEVPPPSDPPPDDVDADAGPDPRPDAFLTHEAEWPGESDSSGDA